MLIAKLADHICADFFFTSLEISNANLKEENTKWYDSTHSQWQKIIATKRR
ncbi:AAEL014954-PA [Aedes aegypti]|uniref:AAEL014954-PA n=1 Tax=Aedes aegypti TaxID=7159 RepID=Q16EZ9_AEDAE|nr:AAEL014954-PA [Aedes aegypti]